MPRPRTTYTAECQLAAVKMITPQKLSVAEFIEYFNRTMTKPHKWTYAGRPLNV